MATGEEERRAEDRRRGYKFGASLVLSGRKTPEETRKEGLDNGGPFGLGMIGAAADYKRALEQAATEARDEIRRGK